mgnify:CR=1 FL=1
MVVTLEKISGTVSDAMFDGEWSGRIVVHDGMFMFSPLDPEGHPHFIVCAATFEDAASILEKEINE